MFTSLYKFTFLFIVLLYSFVNAQDDASMKAFMEYMTPGKAHQQLAAMAGNWDVTVKMYDANAPEPMVSTGTATMEMIMGGRYLQSKFTGTIMGMPMEGLGLDAYDNVLGEYISIWIDNMGTGIMSSKGKINPENKLLELYGSMVDPVTKKEKKTLMVSEYVDADKVLQKMYTFEGEKKVLAMEFEYVRSK